MKTFSKPVRVFSLLAGGFVIFIIRSVIDGLGGIELAWESRSIMGILSFLVAGSLSIYLLGIGFAGRVNMFLAVLGVLNSIYFLPMVSGVMFAGIYSLLTPPYGNIIGTFSIVFTYSMMTCFLVVWFGSSIVSFYDGWVRMNPRPDYTPQKQDNC